MAKINKSLYSKEEFRKLKEEKKLYKLYEQNKAAVPITQPVEDKQYNILCLKHGTKYSEKYVNVLYNMIRRNLSYRFNFYCLTENSQGISDNVQIINLPKHLPVSGWWYKPYVFSRDLPIEGTILYLDLDVVITGLLDRLFLWQENEFCIIRDFTRIMRPDWNRFNSSVMKFKKGQLDHIWQHFLKNSNYIMRRHFGDQDYIYEMCKHTAKTWPDQWIRSWKWEVRKSRQFRLGGRRGDRKFDKIEQVTAPEDCCIAVFHGDPNPHNCEDPYIIEKWK